MVVAIPRGVSSFLRELAPVPTGTRREKAGSLCNPTGPRLVTLCPYPISRLLSSMICNPTGFTDVKARRQCGSPRRRA